jgi:hypothetical protein
LHRLVKGWKYRRANRDLTFDFPPFGDFVGSQFFRTTRQNYIHPGTGGEVDGGAWHEDATIKLGSYDRHGFPQDLGRKRASGQPHADSLASCPSYRGGVELQAESMGRSAGIRRLFLPHAASGGYDNRHSIA